MSQNFCQVVFFILIFFGFFSNFPRLYTFNILIVCTNQTPGFVDRFIEFERIHKSIISVAVVFVSRDLAHNASLIAFNHIRHARSEISEVVSKLVIISVFKFFPSKIAVILCWNVAREIISKGVKTVVVDNFVWINHISNRFTHFYTTA